MLRALAVLLFVIAFAVGISSNFAGATQAVGTGGGCTGAVGNGACSGPTATPSLYPVIAISPPATAYPTSGSYLAAPQGIATTLPTPGGAGTYFGTLEGTTCFARVWVPTAAATPVATTEPTSAATTVATTVPTTNPSPTTYPTIYPTSVPTSYATMWPQATQTLTTPNGITELCSYPSAEVNYLTFDAPNFFNVQQNTTQTGVSINGRVYANGYTTYGSVLSLRIPRTIGWNYTGTTYPLAGTANEVTLAIQAPTVAAQTTSPPQQWAPPTHLLGAFARVDGPPPFGVHGINWPTFATPQPYPSPTTLLYGSTGYCDEQDGSGNSIVNTNPLDFYKMQDIVQQDVQFTRTPVSPFELDKTHSGGGFAWTDMDSALCGIVRNGIEPVVEIDAGPVFYGATENNLYKNPTDYGAECTAVATHVSQTFSSIYRFEIGNNEPNNGGWDASLSDNPTLYAGVSGVSLYSRACYVAIKAVIPNAVVYWGMLDMDASAAPLTFIQGFYADGCRFGYCADGIDIHFSPINDPLANYAPFPIDNGVGGDGNDIRFLDNLISTIKGAGETYPIHILIGESILCPTVPMSTNQQCGNNGDLAFVWPRWLSAAQQNTQYNIDGVVIADLDECGVYAGNTVFGNNCTMQTIFSPVSATWTNNSVNPTPSPFPAYVAIQQYMGINPASPPTVAPSTAPTPVGTPVPPTVVQESSSVAGTGPVTGTTASVTPTLPTTVASGKTTFAFVYIQDNGGSTPAVVTPSGFTLVGTCSPSINVTANEIFIYQSSTFTGSSQAFTLAVVSGSNWQANAMLVEVSGANTSSPVDSGSGCADTNVPNQATTYNTANLTPAQSGTLALTGFWIQDGVGVSVFSGGAPTGWTNLITTQANTSIYASAALQQYNSAPTAGVALQSSVYVGALGYTPQDLASYELFVDHP